MVGKNVRREALLVKKKGYIGSVVAMTLYGYKLRGCAQSLAANGAVEAKRVGIGHKEGEMRLVA